MPENCPFCGSVDTEKLKQGNYCSNCGYWQEEDKGIQEVKIRKEHTENFKRDLGLFQKDKNNG